MKINKTIAESVVRQFLKDENNLNYRGYNLSYLRYVDEFVKGQYTFVYLYDDGTEFFTVEARNRKDGSTVFYVDYTLEEDAEIYKLIDGIPTR